MADVYPAIVVGSDGSQTAVRAARRAACMAAALGSELIVASAYIRSRPYDHGPPSDRAIAGDALMSTDYRAAADVAQDTMSQATKGLDVRGDTATPEGEPADALLDLAADRPGSLLVVGSKGMTDSARFLLGNVPNKVTHHPVGDILIVRTEEPGRDGTPSRVLVGTDGSKTAMRAVQRAVDLVAALGAHLTVLSAGRSDDTGRAIELAGRCADDVGVPWTGLAQPGEAADALVDAASDHDLVIVGNRGMTGPGRFLLGSVPNKVSHHVHRDLLIVKTD